MPTALPASDKHAQIVLAAWHRTALLKNCAGFSRSLIHTGTKEKSVPSPSPSIPESYTTEKVFLLTPEFCDPVSYLNEYQEVSGKGKSDPNIPLLASAEALFKRGNNLGSEVLEYCRGLESKLNAEFRAKPFYGSSPYEERVDSPELAAFILERQLGILNKFQGVNDAPGPQGAETSFASFVLTSGASTVWSGPRELLKLRRAFIDQLMADESVSNNLKKTVLEIKHAADELNETLGCLVNTMQEAARLVEADAKRASNIPKPGFWYHGKTGRLHGEGGEASFNRGRTRTVLEVLIVRRETSVDELMGLIQSTLEPGGDPKRAVYSAIQHLSDTFKEKGLNLEVAGNDGTYRLSQFVELDPE